MPEALYGASNPRETPDGVQRYGSVIGLRPELERRYRELHADAWDSVLTRLHACNIRNYSIFVAELDGKKYLFSYFEYVGEDFARDMRAMADDPQTRRWWQETEPCQIKLPGRAPGEVWSGLERVFYTA